MAFVIIMCARKAVVSYKVCAHNNLHDNMVRNLRLIWLGEQ